MEFNTVLSDMQQQVARIVAKDAKGIIDPDTVAAWTSSDDAVVSVVPVDAAGRACTLTAQKPGNADVTVVCGALTNVIHVHVTVSDDSELDLAFDSPTAQPVAAPAAPADPSAT